MQFSAYVVFQPRQLKNGNFQNCFFLYILTIQNHQISYVKHVLAPLYVFFTLFGCWGGGGAPKGSRAQPAYAVYQPRQLKNGNFQFDILTIQNDQISYVKHVLAPHLCVFHPIWVFWGEGGLPSGPGHNLLMQFSSLGSSKMEISETDLFDTLTIQNDQISYVKHVLAALYVFFTLFGFRAGGLPKGLGHNLLM